MIGPKDSIQIEVQFAAEGIRAGFSKFIDERAADLKAMVGKFCDQLAADSDLKLIEARIRQRVEEEWRVQLERYVQGEAQCQVYEAMQKLRKRVERKGRKR